MPSSPGLTGVWSLPTPTPQCGLCPHPCIVLILGWDSRRGGSCTCLLLPLVLQHLEPHAEEAGSWLLGTASLQSREALSRLPGRAATGSTLGAVYWFSAAASTPQEKVGKPEELGFYASELGWVGAALPLATAGSTGPGEGLAAGGG